MSQMVMREREREGSGWMTTWEFREIPEITTK